MASSSMITPPLRKASSWRILQIIIYLTTVAFSIGTLVGYKGLNNLFKQDMHMCILYATPSVTAKENPSDCEVSLDKSNNSHTCNFVYFNVICSVVYAIIGCWFFIACTTDAKTRPDETVIQSWKLVLPSIFFTCILTLLSTISSSLLTGGVADFTKSFTLQSSVKQCEQFKLFRPENATLFMNELHLYRAVAEVFTWLSAAVWLFAVLVLMCRCCIAADFVTTNPELLPDSMLNGDPSRTGTLASQSSWMVSLRRFVPPLNGLSFARSLKGSLKGWRSDTSINRNLMSRRSPWKTDSSMSSPEMQAPVSPPVVFSLTDFKRQPSTVDDENNDFESAFADSVFGSATDVVGVENESAKALFPANI